MPSMSILYALGSNSSGQLGVGHTADVPSLPQQCIFAVETSDSQDRGGGGGGTPLHPLRAQDLGPLIRESIGEVSKIVAGGNHTLVLTDRGRLFVAGQGGGGGVLRRVDGEGGCEGEGKPQQSNMFSELTTAILAYCAAALEGQGQRGAITHVAASWDVSFAAVNGRVVVSWGDFGARDALTTGMAATTTAAGTSSITSADGERRMWTSFVVDHHTDGKDNDATITAIGAGMAHVVVLLSNGHAYGWGASRKGQLGEQYREQKILRDPRRLDVGPDGRRILPFTPERVILGREYTVFLRRGGKPVIWGSVPGNTEGDWLLGQNDTAVSGWSSVHVLSGSGSGSTPGVVQSMGRNNHGQFAPANLPAIRAIAAGSEHCVALTMEGQVIAWGWGEHGNCGEQVDEKGNVFDRWNVIPLPELDEATVVKDVAAGCATTFVICGEEER
ncbi:hypothetical protein PV04_05671 [Phialophora macrospora]|uniref:Uncharacterized protein n=1 Tax=Phialophora macrospora TaxID=1851006 RepID=A0A0D2CM83_9EURO|nr:hypothetical protein PV04_05671 [Phialophora macrospora]